MENEKETLTPEKLKFPSYKDHLNKTFLEEMGYKIWSTKGPRFNANKRLLAKDTLSYQAIGFLTAYLIIFGLLSVYRISNKEIFSEKIIAFGATTISILLLAFSQMEGAKDYKMRAHMYHECALKLSELYNKLRAFKTFGERTDLEKQEFSQKLGEEYQRVLEHYPNHATIDYHLFRAEHHEYYKIEMVRVVLIQLQCYFETKFLYHFLIVAPPVLFFIALYLSQ